MARIPFRGLASSILFLASIPAWSGTAQALGQSLTDARVSGSIRSALGEPVPRALVSLSDERGAILRTVTGTIGGAYVLRGVGPGSYTLRVEALGFAPQVFEGLELHPGSALVLNAVLGPAGTPPDTVRAAGLGASVSGGRWIGRGDFDQLPVEAPSLSQWAGLSTLVGDDMGMQGLPGQFTRISIDGIPFRPVRPFGVRSLSGAAGLLTGRGAGAIQVGGAPTTVDAPTGAGGGLAVHSRRGSSGVVDGDVAASAGGLRMAATDPDDAPGATSAWAGVAVETVLTPDTSSVAFGVDAWQVERPREALFPESGSEVEGIGAPYLERTRGFAGFFRLDRVLRGGGLLWTTARVGYRPATTDLVGMAYGLADAGQRAELLAGVGGLFPAGRRETIEVRVGASRSAWTAASESGVDLPFEAGAVTVLDPATGLRGGPGPIPGGTASRFDFDAGATMHLERGDHALKVGVIGGVANHSQEFAPEAWGLTAVGTGSPTTNWTGGFEGREFGGDFSASVPRLRVFAGDRWTPTGTLALTFGGVLDVEWLPLDDVRPNVDWFAVSGAAVPEYERRAASQGGSAGFDYAQPGGFSASARVAFIADEVDPLLLAELVTGQEVPTFRGTTSSGPWPGVPSDVSAPDRRQPGISYMVEDPVAPTSLQFQGGIGFPGGNGVRVELAGAYRWTEGLVRRRDLNRAALPHGRDGDGRELWSEAVRVGNWMGPDGETLGRFPLYGPAWEVDQGGWSEYVGFTGRISGRSASGLAFLAEYTWSRTEDNVPGLGGYGPFQGVALAAGADDGDVTVGRSDLDRPHRAVATLRLPLSFGSGGSISGTYRYQSGAPFTPGYAAGIDANLDGVLGNDPAFVESGAASSLGGDWACLRGDVGGFARRNGCRSAATHSVDLRLALGIPSIRGQLFVDALNVLDQEISVLDTALLRLGGGQITEAGGTVNLPFETNPGFGSPLQDRSSGRMIRIGVRVGR